MRFWLGLIPSLALLACRPAPSEPNEYQKNGFYPQPQDLKTPETLLVQERNGQPFYTASAFLIEKERGIFATAKHFVENIGGEEFKIFVNKKVYRGVTAVTPAISDAAFINIRGAFKVDELPIPYKLSDEQKLKIGDTVRVKGLHVHPPFLQMDKILIGIIRGYYGMPWAKAEFVFDDLEAKVSNLAKEVKNKDIKGTSKGFDFISNTYIEVTTAEDHQFSFGGLSGGPVVDAQGRVIGLVAAGFEGGLITDGFHVIYTPWKVIYVTPVKELQKLMALLLVDEK